MKTSRLIFVAIAFSLGLAISVHATNRTWDGSSSGYWSVAANWTPSGVPANGDILTFPGGTPHDHTTNDVANLKLNQIYFTGSSTPDIGGDQITVTNGIFSTQNSGFSYVDMTSILAADQTWGVGNGGLSTASLVLQHNIRLNGQDLKLWATDTSTIIFVENPIQETGNVLIQGPGTTRFYDQNTYAGATTVGSGTLELDNPTTNAIPGALIIGDGIGGLDADVVRINYAGEIPNVAVTVNNSGLLDLNNHNEGFDTLTLIGGHVTTGTGKVSFHALSATSSNTNAARVDGYLNLGSINVPFDVTNNPAFGPSELQIWASISGTGGITKNGTGMLELDNTNTYTGQTIINSGYLYAGNQTALGNGGSGTTLNGGTLGIGPTINNEWLTNNSASTALELFYSSGWSSNIVLNADLNVRVPSPETSGLSGVISGSGGLIKNDTGTLVLAGNVANTFAGTTTVNQGVLALQKTGGGALTGALVIGGTYATPAEVRDLLSNQLGNVNSVTIFTNGVLNLNGAVDFMGPVTFNGGLLETGSGLFSMTQPVTVNPTNVTAVISGRLDVNASGTFNVGDGSPVVDLQITAAVSGGSVALIKNGLGELSLTASNFYAGPTVVNAGILEIVHPNALGVAGATTTTVSNGATLKIPNGIFSMPEDLILNGAGVNGTNGALWGLNNGELADTITLASPTTIRADGNSFALDSNITGTGPLTKIGVGTLTFGASSDNNYTGDTYVNEGSLTLAKPFGHTAIPGNLIIGTGGVGSPAVTVSYLAGCSNAIAGYITVNRGGLYNLNGQFEDLGTINTTPLSLISGGNVQTGTGRLTLGFGTTVFVDPNNVIGSTISGRLGLAGSSSGGSHTFVVKGPYSLAGPELTVAASLEAITSIANVVKRGGGEMLLSGSNSYTGSLFLNDGQVTLGNNSALGAAGAGAIVNSNAVLAIDGSLTLVGNPLTLNSAAAIPFTVLSGASQWKSTVALNLDSAINIASNASLTISSNISGIGALTKVGPGTLILGGSTANTYTNVTVVNEGTLVLSNSVSPQSQTILGNVVVGDGIGGASADVLRLGRINQIGSNSVITINSSGLFDLNGLTETVAMIGGVGNISLGAGSFFYVSSTNFGTFDGIISGSGAVRKQGTGKLTLNGNNIFVGNFYADNGTLLVNGSQPQIPVTVNSATFGGSGTVGNILMSLGTLSPGNSPGILTCSDLTLSGGTVFIELNGTNAGSGYDQLNVRGGVTLTGSPTLSASLGFASAVSNSFTIINNDGTDAVTNTFNGLPQNATFNISGILFKISYTGGTGNDVVLTQLLPLPTLATRVTNTNLVFSWPTNYAGFTLESNTNLATTAWTPIFATPALAGTNYVVTNSMTSPQKFFRLRSP